MLDKALDTCTATAHTIYYQVRFHFVVMVMVVVIGKREKNRRKS